MPTETPTPAPNTAVAAPRTASAEVRTDIPRFLPVAGHHEPAPFYLTADMFGGVPVELAGGPIDHLVGRPVADPHRHEVDEIYFLVSPHPGGARIEVLVDGDRHELTSPALLRVPAGAEHRFLTLEAEPGSYCFGLLLGGER
ncbi:cupin domain-containing protein [Streptomyces sp. T028]|uniref:cupin domain-containing protein n=1 Tax=Streptomyces sp. T028 TaxID=3394379 RepID=UPI003A84FD01